MSETGLKHEFVQSLYKCKNREGDEFQVFRCRLCDETIAVPINQARAFLAKEKHEAVSCPLLFVSLAAKGVT